MWELFAHIRCQGLPLAARIVGGLLCDKSKDEWLTIEETWLSNFGEDANAIMKVLKFSFDHLSLPSLKKCFAYCSIFPKGFCIKREEMIELWMAEGFLTTDPTNDMEILGNKFFNILVQNSLLQVVARDNYGNITKFNMHDLVHDLASSILGSKSTCLNNKSLDGIYQVQYIAKSCPIPKDQARYVRTLPFESKFFDKMFLDFKSLHVLVLKCQDVKELPSLISELIHLRLVDISDTQIECLPDSIGKLYHLQTLRAVTQHYERENHLRSLPNTLKNLISLRHLCIPNINLPPEIGKLTSLQTLRYFNIGKEKGCRIGELGSLKNLKGELEIGNLERVNDKEEARSACLFEKKNIFKLKFEWKLSRKGERDDENVLEGLQPHPNLKSLEIYGFKGSSFPLWTLRMEVRDDLEGRWMGLNNLMEIQLKSCRECEEIPMLGHLPHLKSLYLYDLTSVRSIGSSFYSIENCSTSSSNIVGNNAIVPFPALEKLQLSEMPNLRDWVEIEIPTAIETQPSEVVLFPRLQCLKIKDCNKLTSAPSHFPCLKELTTWGIESTCPFENMGGNLVSLTELRITQVTGLVSLPDALFSNSQILSKLVIWNCPNLTHLISALRGGGVSFRELRISNCPNLRGFPNDLHNLRSLELLKITGCPNLKSIPYPSGGQSHEGFTSLRHLIIEYCEGLTYLASEMIESCAPSLEHLSLDNLSSLTNLPMVIGCLQKMPLLRLLEIVDLPQMADSSTEIGSLHSLQELGIGASSSYALDYTLFQEFLGQMFNGLQSLRGLEFYGMKHWDSLPDQLQHLTTLTDLELSGFGIEALPEWLGNMSSLKTIELYNCQRLRHLPSKEAMERLTKLTLLSIACCPRLNVQRCNEQQSDDSEWPKISHIPRVFVHGKQI